MFLLISREITGRDAAMMIPGSPGRPYCRYSGSALPDHLSHHSGGPPARMLQDEELRIARPAENI